MTFDKPTVTAINTLRCTVQLATRDIDAAESVTIGLWWSFICDHARCHDLDPAQLAREQLEAFIEADPLAIRREH